MMMAPQLTEDIGAEKQCRRICLTAILQCLERTQGIVQSIVSVEAQGRLQEAIRVRFFWQ